MKEVFKRFKIISTLENETDKQRELTIMLISNFINNTNKKIEKEVDKNKNIALKNIEKPLYEYFIMNDNVEINKGIDKLFKLCMIYKISMFEYLVKEIELYEMQTTAIIKALKTVEENNIFVSILEEQIKDNVIFEVVGENLFKNLMDEDNEIDSFLEIPDKIRDLILETTFKMATDKLSHQDIKINNCSYNFDSVKDDLNAHLNILKDKFYNKRSVAKIKNSYLKRIALDEIEFSEKYNAPYLKNYQDGLAIGYSERAFLIGVDKNKAIRELENKIKILSDYQIEESKYLIKNTLKLIELTKQQKHKDKIPFKTIGKKLDMTTNEAKNFMRGIISNNFSDKSFKELYCS